MPGLMQSWFVPKPPAKKPKITVNVPGGGGATAGGASGVAPGTTADDFTNQRTAFYQQMLAGLGQGQPGNQLPQDLQQNIAAQASLLPDSNSSSNTQGS